MEESVVVVEEAAGKMDPVASAGALVQIDSIAIDIHSSMEPPQLEHFSIRGFVAGMRKKNWKVCMPFALKGDNDDELVEYLPPMLVPSFRWWQCSNCAPDNEANGATKEIILVGETGSDHTGPDSYQNVGDENAIVLHIKENTDVGDVNAGNSCDASEANPLQIVERLDNTTDASDMVSVDARPLRIVDNPDNAEPGKDGTLGAGASKRKPKLRSLADIMGTEMTPTTETEAVLSPQPEIDVPVDVAKDAVIPEKKRKIDLAEDEGPSKVICRKAAAKRIKGLNTDAGKNSGRVEVFGSGSEGDASMRLDLKLLGARIDPKKTKAVNSNKKMKQKIHEDRTAPVRKSLHVNGASSANFQKHSVPVEINFGKSGCTPSTIKETGQFFRSSEKISNLSKGKTPEVGADRDPVVLPRKSNLGDSNIRGKAALDLSLNSFVDAANDQARHRGIPDLNEAPLEGNQVTTLPHKSLLLHKTLDASPPRRNGTISEGKRQFRISEPENKAASKELEASDDIPMDIVELLAQNQRERAVENSRYLLGINNSTRGYSALHVDGRPSMINYPLNRPSGLSLRNGNMGVRQNPPQLNSYRLDTSRTEDSLLWSSTRENAPFHLNIAPPKHSIQPNSTCVDSFLNRCHKGKTVTDMKDAAGAGVSTSLGSLDPYSSNDTIPAMQLLSLMDQRVAVRSSSFKVGAKSFLDKSFSPSISNHHPCLNEKKQNFLDGKFFSQNRHSGSKKASGSVRAHQVQQGIGNSKASLSATSEVLGVCTLNRNPADFSIPDARNEFTISAKDLKFRKRTEKSRMVNIEGKKGRQRMRN
ncbi:hypothetical protein ACS0TY_012394 [Phlomoides rotata]